MDLQADVRAAAASKAYERSYRASTDTTGKLLNEKSAYNISGKCQNEFDHHPWTMALIGQTEKPGNVVDTIGRPRQNKCAIGEMVLLRLNYGDLLRPPFRILPSRGWSQCTNLTDEYVIVFGPKHEDDSSIFDTSPYVLPSGRTTPDLWDCDGFFLPADRWLRRWRRSVHGPLALKFWNFRRFSISGAGKDAYRCPRPNGIFEPSQINWAIPNFTYQDILTRLRP